MSAHQYWQRLHIQAAVLHGAESVSYTHLLCQTQIRRCKKAIDLWFKQKAPLIMISGGKAHNTTCEAEAMAEYIQQSDPQIPILMETKAMNTYDNFKYSKQLCDQHQIHSSIVVTSTSHCRRSAYFARKFFDEFAMIGDDEPFSLKKRTREFFATYNTLYLSLIHISQPI